MQYHSTRNNRDSKQFRNNFVCVRINIDLYMLNMLCECRCMWERKFEVSICNLFHLRAELKNCMNYL